MTKRSRKNRNIITGLMVGIASIFAVTYYLEIPRSDILIFFVSTLMFFAGIILLAMIALLLIKGLGRLIKKPDQDDSNSRE